MLTRPTFRAALCCAGLGLLLGVRAHGAPPTARTTSAREALDGIMWVRVRQGKLRVGDPPNVETYTLERPLIVSFGPVTCRQYARFLTATGHPAPVFPSGNGLNGATVLDNYIQSLKSEFTWHGQEPPRGFEDYPVAFLTQDDARAYCRWLSQITGQTYRLPRQAELTYCLTPDNSPATPTPGSNPEWIGDNHIAWYKLGPVGVPSKGQPALTRSRFGLQCFRPTLMEWTSEDWTVSANGGFRADRTSTHVYPMHAMGEELHVFGLRLVRDTDDRPRPR